MVELLVADSDDRTGDELDGVFDFSLDCPGEEGINAGMSTLFETVLNPGLSEVSITGDFTTRLLPLLFDTGLFTSGLEDLSFSVSFLLMDGIILLDGETSFPILLHV